MMFRVLSPKTLKLIGTRLLSWSTSFYQITQKTHEMKDFEIF